ncbi:cytochrome P450 27C1 [Electrophorus electricus]|uniref:Cytochrome P450, family 27, subfamily C, polypeptide 1 n=1 Tax=Electrophorus electricus TaxID=8005 RepID=A0A4W4FER8_ELEEL|nr:cytochrome P450 27C1 [Electrophorus electricus]
MALHKLHATRGRPLNGVLKQVFSQAGARHESAGGDTPGSSRAATRVRAGVQQEQAERQAGRVKSLRDMPGPSAIGNLVELFYRDGFSRIHEIQLKHSQKYGRIFKSRFGPQLVVSIADRGLVAQVLRAEGAAPQRANMDSWKEYRDMRGHSTGLISAEADKWLKMRRVLRQLIMRPRHVAAFSDDVNAVVADLVEKVRKLRRQQRDGLTVLNVNDLFFNYAMEGVASILYETRLGCLEDEIPEMSQEYIKALHLMFSSFKTTMYAGAIPKWLRPIVPKPWEEFCSSWDGLFKFSQIHIDRKLGEIRTKLEKGEEVKGGLLTHMLVTKEMNLEEIYANMTEMLLAGVDTTSFTLSWSTYLLAKHPMVQEQIYEEVRRVLAGRVPTADDIPQLPLIRGLVKETLRLYPVLPGNGRVTQDDIVVDDYFIPKGTQLALCHYSTSMDEETFPKADEFCPDRWLRQDVLERVDNFGSIPFGYGIRSCIGRRIAELEMYLALTQVLQRFCIEVSPLTGEVPAKTHGLLCPGAPINVKFVDRV